jgi:Protein of unknown function (DUF3486)
MSGEKKRRKNGILNRAQRQRAVKGPSPSSSPLQREETEGIVNRAQTGRGAKDSSPSSSSLQVEETGPKRVPIDPIPYKTWKIKKLPPDLKEQLDQMLIGGTLHSCRQLSKWLGDNGFEISHAAIHKYGQKFERRLDAIRLATEQARIVCEQFKDDDAQMQGALLKLVQTQLFEVLTAAREREKGSAAQPGETVAPVNITALARSVSGLVRAETEHQRWAERMRAGVVAVEEKVEEARAKGLSPEAADQIKAVLMEI